jgi:hypothetical protein
VFHLGSDGTLGRDLPVARDVMAHRSPFWVGMGSGRWCGYSQPGDAPVDQRREDAGSLCFDTAPLTAPLEFAGDANVHLKVSVDRPVAQLAARLCSVDPEGRSTRVSFGVFNLTHRDSHEAPQALEPGKIYDIVIPMKHVAQQIAAGYRLRLGLSTSYFPMIWPAPEVVSATIHTEGSYLSLPLRAPSPEDDQLAAFGPAVSAPPLEKETLAEGHNWIRITEDAATGVHIFEVADGEGVTRIIGNDITITEQGYERHTITADDPLSARATADWTIGLSRGDWSMRSQTHTELTSERDSFRIRARMRVWHNDELIKEQDWDEKIGRTLV